MGTDGVGAWSSPEWRARAVAWLDRQLAAAGLERTGEVTQPHLRPWATVLRAPTTGGPVWLKAAAPGTAFEVRLYPLLAQVAPDRVLTPIAVDAERGWIVLPDGGPSLGDQLDRVDPFDAFERILPLYGQLQLDLAPHAGELLALGVTDMRPAEMPARFDEAVQAVIAYAERVGTDAEREACRRVDGLRGAYRGWCEELAAAPGAPSLDHGDLHPWNVLVDGDLGRARFYDWGDSVVSNPFATLQVPLRVLRELTGAGLDDPRVLRVRDAYLEVFAPVAPRAELVRALALACRVGKVTRALVWLRAVTGDGEAGAFRRAPIEALRSLLDDTWLGRA